MDKSLHSALRAAGDLDAAGHALLEHLARALSQSLSDDTRLRGARVVRALLQGREDASAGELIVEALDKRPPAELGSSRTAWQVAKQLQRPLIINALSGQVRALTTPDVPAAPERKVSDHTMKRLESWATHVIALPLWARSGALCGLVSMELRATRQAGEPLSVWEPHLRELELQLDGVGSALMQKPVSPPKAPLSDRRFPELGARMVKVMRALETFSGFEDPVLLRGDTGVGKTWLARWIHDRSAREAGPFVSVHLEEANDELAAGDLFGWVKGAHATATRDRTGAARRAHGGTLFIEEVGDLSPRLQRVLLRLLDEKEVEPLGWDGPPVKVDLRVVLATHQDLEALIAAGRFREDLYHRIAGLEVFLPSLDERREEIAGWAQRFLARTTRGGRGAAFSAEAIDRLQRSPWPGNLRQLDRAVSRAWMWACARAEPGTEPVVVELVDVRDALGPTRPRGGAAPWLQACAAAVAAWVDEAEAREARGVAALALSDAQVFQDAVLREAVRRRGVGAGFELLGGEELVRSRNHSRRWREAQERLARFEEEEGALK